MSHEKLSDALIEYLRTDASFPMLFPAELRGSCANLFLKVIRKQDIGEPILLSKTIAEDLQKKSSYREVEKILITAMHSNLDDVIEYADNRIRWDKLSPDDRRTLAHSESKRNACVSDAERNRVSQEFHLSEGA